MRRAAATGGPLDPPLLLLLDEAANIAPIPNLDEIASTGAGQGVQLLSVFQDMAQVKLALRRTRGDDRQQPPRQAVRHRRSPTPRPSTTSRVSSAPASSSTAPATRQRGQRSTTEGETYRDLAPANVVRGRDPGTALLVYGHLSPAKIRLRPWFQDKGLRALKGQAVDEDGEGVER